jgi:hypothetical protein|tara:strand:+ start:350 stop:1378 length:1029 start_codon:yes stop_codon:yes gene_type:complete
LARDYTKYTIEGLGENMNKRQLVFAIVKNWAAKNNPSLEEIQAAFPTETQGSKGFIVKESEVKDAKRFNMEEPLSIKSGTKVVVSNQWGSKNIEPFLELVKRLRYDVKKMTEAVSTELKIIDLTNLEISRLADFIQSKEENSDDIAAIDREIDALLDESPKYYIVGKLFQSFYDGYFYRRVEEEDYFTLGDELRLTVNYSPQNLNEDDLLSMLRDESLLSMIIKKHNLTETTLSPSNTDFILLFSGYFIKALELLIKTDNNEMIAEFIVNQSIQTIEGEYKVDSLMGDWITNITLELIENLYNYDIKDYDGECEIDGYYFGQANTMGYDFLRYAQDIIDSLI